MLQSDINKSLFPKYDINKKSQIFRNLECLNLYQDALAYETDIKELIAKNAFEDGYAKSIEAYDEWKIISRKKKEMIV